MCVGWWSLNRNSTHLRLASAVIKKFSPFTPFTFHCVVFYIQYCNFISYLTFTIYIYIEQCLNKACSSLPTIDMRSIKPFKYNILDQCPARFNVKLSHASFEKLNNNPIGQTRGWITDMHSIRSLCCAYS